MQNRREFLGSLTLTGTAGILGLGPRSVSAEPPPETTKIRLPAEPLPCTSPMFVAEELLRAEGFTEVQYVKIEGGRPGTERALNSGVIDMRQAFAGSSVANLDAGYSIVILTGVHGGCYELFGNDRVRTVRDLKGKSVAVAGLGSAFHLFAASLLSYVGLDPNRDINWVTQPPMEAMRLFAEGKVDAFMAVPPESQKLRAKEIGHAVVNSMMDRPWSQYYCCMVAGNREFVRKHPVATKRALRALLTASDLCAREPERVARFMADKATSTPCRR